MNRFMLRRVSCTIAVLLVVGYLVGAPAALAKGGPPSKVTITSVSCTTGPSSSSVSFTWSIKGKNTPEPSTWVLNDLTTNGGNVENINSAQQAAQAVDNSFTGPLSGAVTDTRQLQLWYTDPATGIQSVVATSATLTCSPA